MPPTSPLPRASHAYWLRFWHVEPRVSWRRWYLVSAFLLLCLWQVGRLLLPLLSEIRYEDGLRPVQTLSAMFLLKALWIPPVCILAIYLISFRFKWMAAPEGVAFATTVGHLVALGVLVQAANMVLQVYR